jgi:hypothetical protein
VLRTSALPVWVVVFCRRPSGRPRSRARCCGCPLDLDQERVVVGVLSAELNTQATEGSGWWGFCCACAWTASPRAIALRLAPDLAGRRNAQGAGSTAGRRSTRESTHSRGGGGLTGGAQGARTHQLPLSRSAPPACAASRVERRTANRPGG